MKYALSDDYGKKFQLTDSLLKRLLAREDYDRIKTIEPVFVFTNESICKQLKNPGYKHAAVSSNHLYVVNTPAKHDSDLVFVLPLADVEDAKVIQDIAEFLQGDLRESSQHIRLCCKHHLATTEHLLFKAASLALLSTDDHSCSKNNLNSTETLSLVVSKTETSESTIRNCKSLTTSPTASFSQTELKNKLCNGKGKEKACRRPLPKPLEGTELLNASYTSSGLKLPPRLTHSPVRISPSRSMEDLKAFKQTDQIPRVPLTKSQKKYLLASSLNQSWNDILRAEQTLPTEVSSISSEVSTVSIDGTASSIMFNFQKESRANESEMGSQPSSINGIGRRSRNMSNSSEQDTSKASLDEYQVEVFTVAPGSKLFHIIEQSWIYTLIAKTCSMSDSNKATSQSSTSIQSSPSQKKIEKDEAIHKFTQLKNEILVCDQDDELFLLTKELKYASQHYLFVRKAVWKSASLLRYYLTKLKSLICSHTANMSQRLDEFDVAIMIGEFLVSMFQDSEMFSGRNTMLNDNGGRFVREMLDVILMSPKMKCVTRKDNKRKVEDGEGLNDELYDLMASWSDICISMLYEIINAVKQSVWCCNLDIKIIDATMLSHLLTNQEKQLKMLMDHLVLKLTSELTDEWETPPIPSTVVLLYKSLVVLHFVSTHCTTIMEYLKTFYHEEFKYYISKEDNIKKIPPNYPVTCLIASFLPIAIKSITT